MVGKAYHILLPTGTMRDVGGEDVKTHQVAGPVHLGRARLGVQPRCLGTQTGVACVRSQAFQPLPRRYHPALPQAPTPRGRSRPSLHLDTGETDTQSIYRQALTQNYSGRVLLLFPIVGSSPLSGGGKPSLIGGMGGGGAGGIVDVVTEPESEAEGDWGANDAAAYENGRRNDGLHGKGSGRGGGGRNGRGVGRGGKDGGGRRSGRNPQIGDRRDDVEGDTADGHHWWNDQDGAGAHADGDSGWGRGGHCGQGEGGRGGGRCGGRGIVGFSGGEGDAQAMGPWRRN
eukprot:scaffold9473_cov164-Isochrysis_galbana.AAC.1